MIKTQKRFLKNAKGYTPSWSEEIFVIKKVKKHCAMGLIRDLNGEEIVGMFYKKEFQKR